MRAAAIAAGLSLIAGCGEKAPAPPPGAKPRAAGPAKAKPAGPAATAVQAGPALYKGKTPLADIYRFRGRFDLSDPQQPQMEWENAAVGVHFRGSSQVTVNLNNVQNRNPFNWLIINVDGKETGRIKFTENVTTYPVAADLGPGEHTIWLSKGQQYGFGPIAFSGFNLDAGAELLPPPPLPNRRVEFIGSSTLSGWGADSVVEPTLDCGDYTHFPTTNAEHSIPRYAADALQADYQNLSRGAAGILCSFTPGVGTLPQSYAEVIDSSTAAWDFSQWTADAVVLEAGGSDFDLGDGPPATVAPGKLTGYPSAGAAQPASFDLAAFYAAYRDFLETIRSNHPGALIVLVNTKNFQGQSEKLFLETLDRLAASFPDGKVVRFDYFKTPLPESTPYTDYFALAQDLGSACAEHPTPEAARIMGERLATFIRAQLQW